MIALGAKGTFVNPRQSTERPRSRGRARLDRTAAGSPHVDHGAKARDTDVGLLPRLRRAAVSVGRALLVGVRARRRMRSAATRRLQLARVWDVTEAATAVGARRARVAFLHARIERG